MAEQARASEPIRLERDGNVALLVLDDPPLNLFGPHTFSDFAAGVAEVEMSDARALVWRAEGDIFSGGVDVKVFERHRPEARRRRCSPR